jgi:arylsulfatase A-like enzyme
MAPTARRVAIVVWLALAMMGVGSGVSSPARAARPHRPDVIVIVTDDQRIGTVGWMPVVSNYIKRHGVRFSRAMVPTSLCCPSRASLLTGEYSHTTKVWSNDAGWTRFVGAGMESRTMAVWLRRSGYRTGLVGKYLNGYKGTGPPPGWAVWHAFTQSNVGYYNYELRHTNGSLTRHGFDPASYSTDVLRGYASRFIRGTPTAKPLFLYFAPFAPHEPATPAPRHLRLAAPIGSFWPPSAQEQDLSDKPPWIQRLPAVSWSSIQDLRVLQYRTLRSVDEAVASILDAQRARGRLRNTLLVFLSDNGLMWGEHRVLGKFVPYEGATRIPMAIAWPARLPQGRVDARLALNMDIPVTIAAAAGAPHGTVAGRSLLQRWKRSGSVLEARSTRVPGPNGTNVERPAYCGWRTVRFLYVRYANGVTELYDYAVDAFELQNRARMRAYGEVRRRMRVRAQAACRPPPPGFRW